MGSAGAKLVKRFWSQHCPVAGDVQSQLAGLWLMALLLEELGTAK